MVKGGIHGNYLITVKERHPHSLAYRNDEFEKEKGLFDALIKHLPFKDDLCAYVKTNTPYSTSHPQSLGKGHIGAVA